MSTNHTFATIHVKLYYSKLTDKQLSAILRKMAVAAIEYSDMEIQVECGAHSIVMQGRKYIAPVNLK